MALSAALACLPILEHADLKFFVGPILAHLNTPQRKRVDGVSICLAEQVPTARARAVRSLQPFVSRQGQEFDEVVADDHVAEELGGFGDVLDVLQEPYFLIE